LFSAAIRFTKRDGGRAAEVRSRAANPHLEAPHRAEGLRPEDGKYAPARWASLRSDDRKVFKIWALRVAAFDSDRCRMLAARPARGHTPAGQKDPFTRRRQRAWTRRNRRGEGCITPNEQYAATPPSRRLYDHVPERSMVQLRWCPFSATLFPSLKALPGHSSGVFLQPPCFRSTSHGCRAQSGGVMHRLNHNRYLTAATDRFHLSCCFGAGGGSLRAAGATRSR